MLDLNSALRNEANEQNAYFSRGLLHLASPERGRSLGATVEMSAQPISRAIAVLQKGFREKSRISQRIFDCTPYGSSATREPNRERLSWFILNVLLTYRVHHPNQKSLFFAHALDWFASCKQLNEGLLRSFSTESIAQVELDIGQNTDPTEILALLPYTIEKHGHVTRSRLEICDQARKRRLLKKKSGIYYTPADVAQFLVKLASQNTGEFGSWCDPACGTGVLLRAVVHHYLKTKKLASPDVFEFCVQSLFGVDKSALATDSCAFVLLAECSEGNTAISPFEKWRSIKRNIACVDSLDLEFSSQNEDPARSEHNPASFHRLLPRAPRRGFDHVVMNPPYAREKLDAHKCRRWNVFRDEGLGSLKSLHLAFGEMLLAFASPKSTSAAVFPLSIGSNTSNSFRRFREILFNDHSRTEFYFFDREPQALFGEDIKTRNTVICLDRCSQANDIWTSRLLKWTAAQRPKIFSTNRLAKVPRELCRIFVPKLGTKLEVALYSEIRSRVRNIASDELPRMQRVRYADAIRLPTERLKRTFFIGGTAYNFLNCFFISGSERKSELPQSSSPLNSLEFESENLAFSAFATLSSRLCFWLWHVQADGFHVNAQFIRQNPLIALDFPTQVVAELTELGKSIWLKAQRNELRALNGGKVTFSYTSGHENPDVFRVDELIIEHLGLRENVLKELGSFVASTVSIDGAARGR